MPLGRRPSPWLQNIEKLNSKPEFQLFEVGPGGILLGGDLELSKGPDDEFEARIEGVRSGIWHTVLIYEDSETSGWKEFRRATAQWVAEGPLDIEALAVAFPDPNLNPLTAWKKVGSYSVDSGAHGVIDQDGLASKIADAHGSREYVLEMCSDVSSAANMVSAQIGFVIGGDDGGYNIWARKHTDKIVEIMVRPNFEEDGEGFEYEDARDDHGEDEDSEE
ncbi:hypothetical protein BXZ70DRAFT_908686 [Cristinia sonorae]|uniref:Uncharacterized protein n=1 Tax=Cristinia sonorae TaxID=1940300 RepID=A0A8K0UJM1_9AGAR|nr:hypothetical protein BXZ70DRAFT_908686 [Cristinia sonorae]